VTQWLRVFDDTLLITLFVFITMLIVDYANVATVGRLSSFMRLGPWRQYITAAVLGATPGCVGAFFNVSSYTHGLLSFGALTGGMVAATGDEAFVMLRLFPEKAIPLFAGLALIGVGYGYAADWLIRRLRIVPSRSCDQQKIHTLETCSCAEHRTGRKPLARRVLGVSLCRGLLLAGISAALILTAAGVIGPDSWNWEKITLVILLGISNAVVGSASDHFLKEHVWAHLVRKHLWRVFLWTLAAMAVVEVGLQAWDIHPFVRDHKTWMLLLSALVGIIPQSGPNLVFVVLFSKGLVPFSILVTNSIVQDGHGMLPLLSYSVRDAVLVKTFNVALGLALGSILYGFGL